MESLRFVPVNQQTNRSRHSGSRPPGSRPGESRPVDDGEHARRDYAAAGGGSGISAQRQNPKHVPQGGELIPTQRRQISTSSSSSSSSSATHQVRQNSSSSSSSSSSSATQQVRQNSSSSSTSSSRFVTPGEGRSATHPLSGTGRPSRHEESMCHQNFGYVGISEDKRRLAESENQIKYQLAEYERRTGFDTSNVEDMMLRPIKKQQLNGNVCGASMLAELSARSLKWHVGELKSPPSGPLEESSSDDDEPSAPNSRKRKGDKCITALAQREATRCVSEGGSGDAASVDFYVKQRHTKEDADIQGVSRMKMDALAKSFASSRAQKIDEKILSSVLESGTFLATDLGSLLMLQQTQTLALAQVVSDVTQLTRKLDAFLQGQRREQPPVQVASSTTKHSPEEIGCPRSVLISFRTFMRKKVCQNPTSEVETSYKKKPQKRGDFFDLLLLEGGVLALEFFKGRDLSTASSMVRMHSPEKGWRALTAKNFRNLKSDLNSLTKKNALICSEEFLNLSYVGSDIEARKKAVLDILHHGLETHTKYLSASDNGASIKIQYEDSIDKVLEALTDKGISLTVQFLAYTAMVALSTRNPLFRHECEIKLTDPRLAALYHFVILEIICKAFNLKCMSNFPGISSESRKDVISAVKRIQEESENRVRIIKEYCVRASIQFPEYAAMYFRAEEGRARQRGTHECGEGEDACGNGVLEFGENGLDLRIGLELNEGNEEFDSDHDDADKNDDDEDSSIRSASDDEKEVGGIFYAEM